MAEQNMVTVVIPILLLVILKLTDIARETDLSKEPMYIQKEVRPPIFYYIPKIQGEYNVPVFKRVYLIHTTVTFSMGFLSMGVISQLIQNHFIITDGIDIFGAIESIQFIILCILTLTWFLVPVLEFDYYGTLEPKYESNKLPYHPSIVFHAVYALLSLVTTFLFLLTSNNQGFTNMLYQLDFLGFSINPFIEMAIYMILLLLIIYFWTSKNTFEFLQIVQNEMETLDESNRNEDYYGIE